MSITTETLRKLAQFDTPTISNVIEQFDVRPDTGGFTDHRIRANFPELPPMVGFASTATFRSCAPPRQGDAYRSLVDQAKRFEELPGPAVVVFQDLDDPPVGATFGEVMCSAYRAFGSVGLVTSGAGRDLEQVHALRFPVFTASTICSHACCHILHLGCTVRVGGLVVNPGDLLHGDANGVLSIPLEIADEVPDAAVESVAAERIVLDYCQGSGEKTLQGLAEIDLQVRAAFKKLRDRVSRKPR